MGTYTRLSILCLRNLICAGNGEQLFPFSVNWYNNTSKTRQIREQITEKHGVTQAPTHYALLPHVSSATTRFSALMLPFSSHGATFLK